MAIVACLLLLLLSSIAGHATPASPLATVWQAKKAGEGATGNAWLHTDRIKTPSAMRHTAEPDEVLVKRTPGSPSHHPWLSHRQGTFLQPVLPDQIFPISPPAAHVLGAADHIRGPALSRTTPSHIPAGTPSTDRPSARHTEPGSSSKQPYKAKRRPYGSLKNNPALQAQAARQKRVQMIQRIKDGEQINRTRPGGVQYATPTFDEFKARARLYSKRSRSMRTEEEKAKIRQQNKESARRIRAKRREQREAELEGRSWQGSPVRKPGRPRQYWDDEQAGVGEVRHQVPTHLAVEEAPQRAVESSSGSWTVPRQSLASVSPQEFAPEPSSPSLDLRLSLTRPGPATSGQIQTIHAPRQSAPLAATREEKRLRLTLAPPRND